MERKTISIPLAQNPKIAIKVIPGHFITSSAHISHYLDVSTLKTNSIVARDVARELAFPYLSTTLVDTIVCIENTRVIGAYLAEELLQNGRYVINRGGDINVITPRSNTLGQLTFYDSEIGWVTNKNILLLVATISSGKTVNRTLECLEYYGGKLVGISALFLASPKEMETNINYLFTSEDIPGYNVYRASECEMCKKGQEVDAIVSNEGYNKMKRT